MSVETVGSYAPNADWDNGVAELNAMFAAEMPGTLGAPETTEQVPQVKAAFDAGLSKKLGDSAVQRFIPEL